MKLVTVHIKHSPLAQKNDFTLNGVWKRVYDLYQLFLRRQIVIICSLINDYLMFACFQETEKARAVREMEERGIVCCPLPSTTFPCS